MIIGGLQKTTLIDFPGRIACTVFTVGCNFRCPFCHNRDLAALALFKKSGIKPISEKDFFAFLASRKKILDGACITGGEPTLQADLPKFCKKIKDLGLEVKVDTNGSNPGMLKKLIEGKLVDYIAMDIKTVFSNYAKTVLKLKIKNEKIKIKAKNSKLIVKIKQSIKLILKSKLEYEFRTTVVPGIHDKNNLLKMAKQIKQISLKVKRFKGLNWTLQQFRPKNCLDPEYLKVKPFSSQEMRDMLEAVQKILPNTKLRGST